MVGLKDILKRNKEIAAQRKKIAAVLEERKAWVRKYILGENYFRRNDD